jgi:hypothetical protein
VPDAVQHLLGDAPQIRDTGRLKPHRLDELSDGQDFRFTGSDPHHFANAFAKQLPRQR